MQAYSQRYENALALAARAHLNQVRKVGGDPYIVHLAHVSVILLRHGFSEDVIIAGLLHDAVEDQDIRMADIEAGFGPEVAGTVGVLTERKQEDGAERPWQVRKQEALDQLRRASQAAVAVKAADTLHNAHSLALGLRREGPSIWHKFSSGPQETLWYYRSVATLVRERLGAHPLAKELDAALGRLDHAAASTVTEAGAP